MRQRQFNRVHRRILLLIGATVAGLAATGISASRAMADTTDFWDVNGGGAWSDTTKWDTGVVPDDTNLSDGSDVIVRTTSFTVGTGATITLDASHTVDKFWYANSDGTSNGYLSNARTLDLSTSNGSVLTLAGQNSTPQIAIGRFLSGSTYSFNINVVLAGTQGFSVLESGSPYAGKGLVLTQANTISGTVTGFSLLTLTNRLALQNASISIGANSSLKLLDDTDGDTFTTAGLATVTNSSTAGIIYVDQLTAGGGSNHTLKVSGDFTQSRGAISFAGGNGYSVQLTGNYSNTAPALLRSTSLTADSANVRFTGSSFDVGSDATYSLTIGGSIATGVNEITAPMTGSCQVIKAGVSVWKFSGNSTYTGTTSLTGGTLLINGSTSGQGSYSFGTLTADTMLGGTGKIGLATNKSLTLTGQSASARAIMSPGDSSAGNTIGTLAVNTSGSGKTTFGDYSVLNIELDGNSIDRLDVQSLDLSSTLNSLVITAINQPAISSRHVFLTYTGTLTVNDYFKSVSVTGINNASIDYSVPGEIAVVPEPSLMIVVLPGLACLARRRGGRRRR